MLTLKGNRSGGGNLAGLDHINQAIANGKKLEVLLNVSDRALKPSSLSLPVPTLINQTLIGSCTFKRK